MRRAALAIVLASTWVLAAIWHTPAAQTQPGLSTGTALPSTCWVGSSFVLIGGSAGLYLCTATDTWTVVAPAIVPSGSIVFRTSGTCPTGWTEVSALSGKTLLGTVNANGDVGTTGGSDSVTPTFTGSSSVTSAAVFTGSSATSSAVSAGVPAGTNASVSITPLGTNAATATTGNCAATNLAIGTGATTACKATAPNLTVPAETFTGSSTTVGAQTFTGAALGTHTHTLTATGTNGTGTVTPLGTISAIDTRSAFVKVIACSKT